MKSTEGMREGGGQRGGLPSFKFLGRVSEAQRHSSEGDERRTLWSSQTLVWGRGLVVLRRGGSEHVVRISCCEGLIVPMLWRAVLGQAG